MSTCRSSRACPVFLTQTLPTLYARMGHTKRDAAQALIGKFGTIVAHQNACHETNEYVSKVIGRDIKRRRNEGYSKGYNDSKSSTDGYNNSTGSTQGASWNSGGQTSFNSGHSSNAGSSTSYGHTNGSSENFSNGSSEHMDFILEPNFFATKLKSGGPRNKNIVTAVWFKTGATFHHGGGRNFMVAEFKQ